MNSNVTPTNLEATLLAPLCTYVSICMYTYIHM